MFFMAFFWNSLKRPWKSGLLCMFAFVMPWCCICSFRKCITMAQSILKKKNNFSVSNHFSISAQRISCASCPGVCYERDKHLLQTGTHSSLSRTPNRHQTGHTAVWQAAPWIIKGSCLPVPWPTVRFGQATHFIHLWFQTCFLKAKTLFSTRCSKRGTLSLCRILQSF